MATNIRGRNYLKLLDYSSKEIRYLLDLAKNFKDMKRAGVPHRYLEGKNIVLLFEKTSTRTRCSFEVLTLIRAAARWVRRKVSLTLQEYSAECMTASSTEASVRSW